MDNVEDLQKQIAKLDRIMAKSLQRRGEIEQILFDVATGKLPPPSPQDCRVLALKLGTDKADWPEQIANHVWQGIPERDALAAQVEVLGDKLSEVVALLDVDGMTAVQWLLDNCPEIEQLVAATPAVCLAQVRAEAGRVGYLAAISERHNWKGHPCEKHYECADQYAERIRQEVE